MDHKLTSIWLSLLLNRLEIRFSDLNSQPNKLVSRIKRLDKLDLDYLYSKIYGNKILYLKYQSK